MSNIQITGRHLEITQAIKDYVNKKFERLERHFDHITQVHVVLSVEKTDQIAEATLNAAGHASFFAESKDVNLYAAIDHLVDMLNRQIVKHKEKLQP